jgi:hypothetical protein
MPNSFYNVPGAADRGRAAGVTGGVGPQQALPTLDELAPGCSPHRRVVPVLAGQSVAPPPISTISGAGSSLPPP